MAIAGWVVIVGTLRSRWHFDCGGLVMSMVVHAAVMLMVVLAMVMLVGG